MTAGIYAGSFNPFHIGHLDIALKAKNVFDRVFIVQAKNPDKKGEQAELPYASLERKGFACVVLDAGDLLTNFITRIEGKKKEGVFGAYSTFDNVCVIRGLRNSHDLVHEQNLHDAYKKLKPDINIIHIFSKPEFNYISSSLLRSYSNLAEFQDLIVK